MDRLDALLATDTSRRRLLGQAAIGSAAIAAAPLAAQTTGQTRSWAGDAAFADKRGMILQRVRPPLLETPMSVFDGDVFTPNDRFFVRWHWGDIPPAVDIAAFRLRVSGMVARPLSITLGQLLRMPRVELAAVNQCSGNSRGLFQPPVPGAQWGHGAMGNASWVGVPLRHVLDLAGVKPDARQVRFGGADRATADGAPDFLKSLDLDHARDGEVMIAFQMNGEQL
ncbi:MAG TPA: molybdopterin-dependent oxidoreductase, partial [Sphingomonas sp.]|nr:molybdopterin-dependent oxidoreductase [Sphingomonas sp.]